MKSRKTLFAVALLLVFSISHCIAQQSYVPPNSFDLKKIIPTSPEAAMLGRFGDIPVGYYTGTANISVPLYTINVGTVSVPITLSYQSSGIKVEDEATAVGLGWSLEPGGSVIGIINGKTDINDNLATMLDPGYNVLKTYVPVTGALSARSMIGHGAYPCGDVWPGEISDTPAALYSLQAGMGQPDFYQFSFPGGSGKFYLNPETSEIVQMNKTVHVKIQGGPGGSWTMTTMNGERYFFNVKETSLMTGQYPDEANTTWKLGKIITADDQEINFEYGDGKYSSDYYSETYHTDYPFNLSGGNPIQKNSNVTSHQTKYLKKITTSKETINFIYEDREDIGAELDNDGDASNGVQSIKRVKAVEIIANETLKKIKSFNFTYDYFISNTMGDKYPSYVTGRVLGKRLKLLKLQEVGYNSAGQAVTNIPPYEFEYFEDQSLPGKTSFSRDYWGYYNGKANTKMIPDISFLYHSGYYPYTPPEFWVSYSDYGGPIPLYPYEPHGYLIKMVNGADRAPDQQKMKTATLKKIKYPTGGATQFDYEPHTFSNYIYPTSERLAQTIKNFNLEDYNMGPALSQNFKLKRALTLKFYCYIDRGNTAQGLTFNDLQPSVISIVKLVNGSFAGVVKTWQLLSSDRDAFEATGVRVWEDLVDFPYDPNADYVLHCNLVDQIGPQNTATKNASMRVQLIYYDVDNSAFAESYGGGLRIAAIKNFDGNGQLVQQKQIKYLTADNRSSGLLMSRMQHAVPRMMYFEYSPDGLNVLQADGKILNMSSESILPFSASAQGSVVGYSRVEEIDVSIDGLTKGKKVYHYENDVSRSSPDFPDDPVTTNGLLKKEEVFNGTGDTLLITTYNYSSPVNTICTGYKTVQNYVLGQSCELGPVGYEPNYVSFLYYPIRSSWNMLQSKVSKQYSGGNVLTSSESYTYNSIGQMSKLTTPIASNRTRTKEFVYPIDSVDVANSPVEALKVKWELNHLLKERNLLNNIELSRAVHTYEWGYGPATNEVVKEKTETSINRGPLASVVEFDAYNALRNVAQVTQSGVTTSLLWSTDNTYIVGEVKNARLPLVAYSGFEGTQYYGWTFPAAGVNTSVAYTGNKCYLLSAANTISRATEYVTLIVSYWSRSSTPYTIAGTNGTPTQGKTINGWTYFEHKVTGTNNITITGAGYIDDVRLYPLGAQMNTYVYSPLVGITSITDTNNNTNHFEYDEHGRMILSKDTDLNLLKRVEYVYKMK